MGWTVLYIAFGVVALWLLGEVLLQYKARLRWRLLAFTGFLCVVIGVLMPSVPVIALGAIAFATGQTYVTLSFRKGFSTGWAIGGKPGESRRRRGGGAARKPTLEVSGLEVEYEGAAPDAPPVPAAPPHTPAAVYETEPMPEDTGQYGVYGDPAPQRSGPETPDAQGYDAYAPYTDFPARPAQDQDPYAGAGQYDYGTDPQSYAAYSDPYIGTTASTPQYGAYDGYGGTPQYDPYAQPDVYGSDTPPGGVWVPQQRESEQYPQQPAGGPAPYPDGYDTGHDGQYRY
ncbi:MULTISPECIES: hypothetical protein [unclassified Streptomyces]|uniref:hypothetical protein n=1 Tax=unclassified Streptomyces TaxID=2593676 RepID=UPI000DAEE8C9|nr:MULTISPECIES: hypothetical protein [unclassified Streptomyces]PZT74630.1 hypothetical protein DNK55_21340 [Streptomyces sp. AC1-42T]PZT82383.1 hypothetical protein DNK56_10105 [Streptomyces sp. AC1-42W]